MIDNITEREKKILSLLSEDPGRSVSWLSKSLEVSPVTVRNDLNSLAEKGVLIRTWGGAFPSFHPDILERRRFNNEEKNKIAKAAAELIGDGDTVMIEAGTTTALIAKYLFGKRDINIVSTSTLVLPYARANPALQLTIIGGQFRASTESAVGPSALRELERFHVSKAFVGTDGFSTGNGMTTHLVEGAEIVKKMSEQAEETILVADSSKYGKSGFVKVLPLSAVEKIICDSGLSANDRKEIEESGIDLLLV